MWFGIVKKRKFVTYNLPGFLSPTLTVKDPQVPYLPLETGTVAYTLTASLDSLVLTGAVATLRVAKLLSASPGALVLTGSNATLTYTPAGGTTFTLTADPGTLVLTGVSANLLINRVLTASPGSLVLTPGTVNLRIARVLTADAGSLVLSGSNAILVYTPAGGGGVIVIFYRGVSKSPHEGEGVSLPGHILTPAGGGTFTVTTFGTVSMDKTDSPNYEGYDY